LIYLIISIAVLAIAPLLAKLFQATPRFESFLSGFLLIVLGGIIVAELLPLSIKNGGWLAIPLALLGLTGPSLIEKLFHRAADSTHQLTLLVGFSGLLLHTMADGASLNDFSAIDSASKWLPLAIVLHRIPVALSVLWIIRPVFGFKAVWLALFSLALFTIFGYVLGLQLEPAMNSMSFAWLQAFVSGTLMHVLLHRPHRHEHSHSALPDNHSHEHKHETVEHDHQHSHSDPTHSHSHTKEESKDSMNPHHEHGLTEQLKQWDRYKLLGSLLGAATLAILSELH